MFAVARFGPVATLLKTRAGIFPLATRYQSFVEASSEATVRGLLQQAGVPIPADGTLPSRRWLIAHWLVPDYQATLRRLRGSSRQLVRGLFHRLEVENLKYACRTILAGQPVRSDVLLDLDPVAAIGADELVASKTVVDLVRTARGSVFAEPLRKLTNQAGDQPAETLPVEAGLDRIVYAHLWQLMQAHKGPAGMRTVHLLRRLLSCVSLLWVVRYRLSYELPTEAAVGLAFFSGSAVLTAHLREVAQVSLLEELQSQLEKRPAMPGWVSPAGDATLAAWEIQLWRRLYRSAQKALLGTPFDLALILGVLLMKELIIRDLSVVCEARRFGLAPQETLSRLVCTDGIANAG